MRDESLFQNFILHPSSFIIYLAFAVLLALAFAAEFAFAVVLVAEFVALAGVFVLDVFAAAVVVFGVIPSG